MKILRQLLFISLLLLATVARGQSNWRDALAGMPLGKNLTELDSRNYTSVILNSFRSNATVKSLIFMPGAVDTFFWNKSQKVTLSVQHPSLLDAVNALTNQTRICADFQPPFLLLRTAHDPLEATWKITDPTTADHLSNRPFLKHVVYVDQDWNSLLPQLKKGCGVDFTPKLRSKYSFHFYRNSFAAWNLTAWEALQAVALAEQTTFTVDKKKVSFEEDPRASSQLPP